MNIIQMEPEFFDKNPNKVALKIFASRFHFKPISPNKTQRFYEFILVCSNFVSIKHYKDQNDSSIFTHSSIQILQVLTPSD